MWYKNIAGRFFGLITKHACDRHSDGRTDGQNYDSQDRVSIAASRGKNYDFSVISPVIIGKIIENFEREFLRCYSTHYLLKWCMVPMQNTSSMKTPSH